MTFSRMKADVPVDRAREPLAVLTAGHRRIEVGSATLRRLVARLEVQEVDEPASAAASAVLRCFDAATNEHEVAEEFALFPALVESVAGSDPVCLRDLIRAMTTEHRALASRWERLRAGLQRIASGEAATLPAAGVEALLALYARHIEREESELFPMACRLLGDAALAAVGDAMPGRAGDA